MAVLPFAGIIAVHVTGQALIVEEVFPFQGGPDVLEDVGAALEGEHFLDDQRLARDVYRYYARKGQYGHLYIVNRLRRRCLPVPEDVERPDEYALAGDLVKRKFSYRADEARKAARFLQYRGFSPSVIRDVLEDFTVH